MTAAPLLLTYTEVAAQLRVSKTQVRRLVRAGKLKVVRLGLSAKADRVHPEDLTSFVNESRQVQACPSPSVATPGRSLSVTTGRSIVDLLGSGPSLKRVK